MPQSNIIANAAPCNLGISMLELVRSYIRILVQPLHDIMSFNGTTEMKACFIAEKNLPPEDSAVLMCAESTHKIPDVFQYHC